MEEPVQDAQEFASSEFSSASMMPPPSEISSSPSSSSSMLSMLFRLLLRLGYCTLGVLVVVGGILYVKQDSLLYFPEIGGLARRTSQNPRGYRSPEEHQIPYENLTIPCSDGVHIHAWLLLRKGTGKIPTIIFFHGNAGNIGLRLPNAAQMLQHCVCNVLLVEYRGYGESDSVVPNEAGLKLDAEAALLFAMEHPKIDDDNIFVFGRSLGGAVAFHLAEFAERKKIPLAGVIVENTFLSISAMVDRLMPWLTPIKPFVLKIGWNSDQVLQRGGGLPNTPLLFLSGSNDELVPSLHMQELVRLASQSSPLVRVHIIQGGTHNESWFQGGSQYWDAIRHFLREAMEQKTNKVTKNRIKMTKSTALAEVLSSDGGTASIPTMSSNFLEIAKEAASGSSSAPDQKVNKKTK